MYLLFSQFLIVFDRVDKTKFIIKNSTVPSQHKIFHYTISIIPGLKNVITEYDFLK